ncbi:hypothetical protein [Actinoplanes sp. NPDC026623]|uniref:hypothetical protein n=1 Tax=Actinoplanes sp. NPDC026623 TaxID=3155610 RepID=UPI0033E9D4F3
MARYGHWVLFAEDIAAIWTEERRSVEGPDAPAVPVDRVWDFLRWSKPTPEGAKRPHRYENHPMPYPREARGPNFALWSAEQVDDLRAFWHDRLPKARRDPGRIEQREAEWEQDLKRVKVRTR